MSTVWCRSRPLHTAGPGAPDHTTPTTRKDHPMDQDQTEAALRQRIETALREHGTPHLGADTPADEYECCATVLLPLFADHAAQTEAATWRAAADFVRDAHFRDGLTVQEIGTALRHTADRAGAAQDRNGQ